MELKITTHTCSGCGSDITALIKAEYERRMFEYRSKGGKKNASLMHTPEARAKANASYTPEKRKLAAQKRLATLAAKKLAKID